MATPILRNVQKFGGCSTTCQTGLVESVGSKMDPFVCLARTRLRPQSTHTTPSVLLQWVILSWLFYSLRMLHSMWHRPQGGKNVFLSLEMTIFCWKWTNLGYSKQSSVSLNCQVTNIVIKSGSQLSELQSMSQRPKVSRIINVIVKIIQNYIT